MSMSHPFSAGLRHLVLGLVALTFCAPAATALASPLDWIGGGERISGSGSVQEESRNPGHFDGVALGTAGDVELRIGDTESVTVITDDNLLPYIETTVENGTLKIRARKNTRISPSKLRFVVQARHVERLTVGGSGSITTDSLRAPSLNVEVGGSGSVHVRNLDSDSTKVQIGGSGNFSAAGRTDRLSTSIGGSGSVETGKLSANQVRVSIGGSGQAVVWAKQTLSVSVGGSGDIRYYGDPEVSKSIAGSGSVKRLGATP